MKISVDTNNVKLIEKEQIESGEYNVTPCSFEFSEEYTGLIKTAVFTREDGNAYKMLLQDDSCTIPYEVLEKEGTVELGVYGYVIEDDDLKLRYSPKPCLFAVSKGSYKEAQNSTPPTPTQFEQYEQALEAGLEQVANVDIDATKTGGIATVTITDRTGTEKSVQVEDGIDGVGLNYNWSGTSLGIKREDEGSYEYVNLKGDKGDAGAIKMVIVQELPTTGQDDTIYLVPLETPETEENKYAEYVWIDNEWELLGKIGIQVDLTDYYTKTETNNLLDTKQALIDSTHKLSADLVDDTSTTNKFVTTSEKSTWNAKYDKPSGGIPSTDLADTYVKPTDYATSSVAGVFKTSSAFGTSMSNGVLYAGTRSYENYQSAENGLFISKGTLENVITGKNLVSNTDYATASTGGVIKSSTTYGTDVSLGNLSCRVRDYSQYQSADTHMFVGKGTLENVLTERIGSIDAVLDAINGEVI